MLYVIITFPWQNNSVEGLSCRKVYIKQSKNDRRIRPTNKDLQNLILRVISCVLYCVYNAWIWVAYCKNKKTWATGCQTTEINITIKLTIDHKLFEFA
jgi:hypothetical protein